MTEIPIPDKDTDLFKLENFGYSIACIQDISFGSYAMGYLDACNIILEKMESDRSFISDTCVFPIIYIFRQFLEIKLKQIILIGLKGKGAYVKKENLAKTYGHDIVKSWNDAKKCIKSYWHSSQDEIIDIVEKNVYGLQNVFSDSKGMVFRYPIDYNGNSSFKKDFHLDLKQIKSSIEKIASFLDGCTEGMIAENEVIADMKLEFNDLF